MKPRIHCNSLRFRLSRSDGARFLETGCVAASMRSWKGKLEFPGRGRLTCAIDALCTEFEK